MINYKRHIDGITEDFDNKMYTEYLRGLWGYEEVGYRTDPIWMTRLNYTIAIWQQNYDCSQELCAESKTVQSNVVSIAGGYGSSPFPQIMSSGCCTDGFRHHHISGDLL